ncbi:MAG: hypothetical protein IJW84_03950 [Alphaproteobacteria bacterium]|nr:hypothetical protein [Alphaproteobacteria bacterium]
MNRKINQLNNNKFPLRMFLWAITIGIIFTFAMTYDDIRQTALNASYTLSGAQKIALQKSFMRSLIFVPINATMTATPMFIAWKRNIKRQYTVYQLSALSGIFGGWILFSISALIWAILGKKE